MKWYEMPSYSLDEMWGSKNADYTFVISRDGNLWRASRKSRKGGQVEYMPQEFSSFKDARKALQAMGGTTS